MRSKGDLLAFVDDQNPIRPSQHAETVRDDNQRPASGDCREIPLDDGLAFRIQRACGFVEDENLGLRQQRAGDG